MFPKPLQGCDIRKHAYQCQPGVMLIIVLVNAVELMPISCHFRDCKALLVTSLTHVSGAVASVQTFWTDKSWVETWKISATDCCWSLVAAGSMPVVQTWQNNVVQNPSQLRWRRGHLVWTIAVRFWHWHMTQVGSSLLDTVVQDHVKPYRLTSKQSLYCIRCGTGSQWSRSRSTRLMRSNLFCPQMSRRALFITACSRFSWYCGAPASRQLQ